MRDLAETFYQYFDVAIADTDELRDEVYHLRYQVYCVEKGFEAESQCPGEKEIDEYDVRRAVHSVVRHRQTGLLAATVRLVLPDPDDLLVAFPVEEHCAASFETAEIDWKRLPRNSMAEISRFAVSKHFKRRLGEAGTIAGVGPDPNAYGDANSQGMRLIPHLSLGLFAAILRMSTENGVANWYAVMEPSLLRLLTRFGIEFTPIGGVVNYRGQRQPCYGGIERVLAEIWKKRPDVWRLVTDNGAIWPAPTKNCVSVPQINTKLAGSS